MSDTELKDGEAEFNIYIVPYQFELVAGAESDMDSGEETASSDDSDDDENADANIERIGHVEWCLCGNCRPMDTGLESVCCQEINLVREKAWEDEHQCITGHEGFIGNCLNRHVLEVSLFEFVKEEGPLDDNDPPHNTYRYIAYRRFARWIWHLLGRKVRKVLPACAIHTIRDTFPSEEYTGFKYALP